LILGSWFIQLSRYWSIPSLDIEIKNSSSLPQKTLQISCEDAVKVIEWLDIVIEAIDRKTVIQANKPPNINHYCVISDSNSTSIEENEICRWKSSHSKIQLIICGNNDLFPKLTPQVIESHFLHTYHQIINFPEQLIKNTECLPEAELNKIIYDWNSTEKNYPLEKNISELFYEQVKQVPNQTAIRFKQQSISYNQLNIYTNQFAQFLLEQNIRQEDKVGICLPRSPLWPIAMLAIWRIGAIFLPLESELPDERLKYIIQDSDCNLIVTQEGMKHRFTSLNIPISTISLQQLENFNSLDMSNSTSNESLAYIIYTSGTTGLPKGVKVSHRGLTNLPFCQFERMEFSPNQRILQAVSFNFDASLHDVTFAFLSGSSLCIADENERLPGPAMVSFLRNEKINFVTLPPSALEALPFDDLPELHTILAVGEVCSSNLVQRWVGKKRFFNGYGPTETTVGALIGECHADEQKPTIGKALSNVKVYILDHRKKPVPVGVIGEIYVGGVGVAQGYVNQHQRTKETFIPNPFSQFKSKLYKTGDKARFLTDGRVDFVGRIDDQVKIAGRRIELEEIESCCKKFPSINMAAVIVHQEKDNKTKLRAFITLKNSNDQLSIHETIDGLKEYLAKHLPTYMLPNQFFLLKEMPKNINGKLDRLCLQNLDDEYKKINFDLVKSFKLIDLYITLRFIGNSIYLPICYFVCNQNADNKNSIAVKLSSLIEKYLLPIGYFQLGSLPNIDSQTFIDKLPIPTQYQKQWQSIRTEPYTKTQKLLAQVWKKHLSINDVYLDDNLIELGGDSLTAVNIIKEIKELTNIELNGADLFGSDFGYSCACLTSKTNGNPIEILNNKKQESLPIVKAFYVSGNKNKLYAVYHPSPTNINSNHSVLICPSITNDYQRSRPLLQQLAVKLSTNGYSSMRFDYSGTGDSSGDYTDGSIDQYKSDILSSLKELCTRSECSSVSIFGLRFSATLLTNMEFPKEVKQLILFDPIENGNHFINTQRKLHTDLLKNPNHFQWRKSCVKDNNYEELLGQELTISFVRELKKLKLKHLDDNSLGMIRITSKNNLESKLPISAHKLKEDCYWQNQNKIVSSIIAPSLHSRVITILNEMNNG